MAVSLESFFVLGAESALGKEDQLVKLASLINWHRMRPLLRGIHRNDVNSQGGQHGYDKLKMLKALLLGQWHNLSDRQLARSLRVRIDFMYFTGLEPGDDFPDDTTLCRFRNKLIEKRRLKKLFKEINCQLESLGLAIESADGAVIDATVVASAARPRRTVEVIADDRDEIASTHTHSHPHCEVYDSVDADAKWLKKGKKTYFGYKGFASVDVKHGFIQHIHATAANAYEGHELERIISELPKTKAAYADKAYYSKDNREMLKAKGKKSRLMHKAKRGSPLTVWQKRHNKLISRSRFKVEQCFGTLKRRFAMARASYLSLEKVEAQLCMKATCFNLLKAVNMMVAAG